MMPSAANFRMAVAGSIAGLAAGQAAEAVSVSTTISRAFSVNPNTAFVDAPAADLGDASAFGSDATEARFFEFGTPPSFFVPQFDPADGTLTSVEITYETGSVSPLPQSEQSLANRVVVGGQFTGLDTECGAAATCSKTLEVLTRFVYGLDIDGVVDGAGVSLGGAIFDVAADSGLRTGSFATDGSAPGSGSVLGMPAGVSATETFFGGQIDPFIGTGDLEVFATAAARTRLDLQCVSLNGQPLEACEELVQVNFAPVFDVTWTYVFEEAVGAGDGFQTPGDDTGGGETTGDFADPGGDGGAAVVPLPAGLAMMATALGVFGLLRRRRERPAATG